MNVNLLTTYHTDNNQERMKEFLTCLEINNKKEFRKIYLFGNEKFEQLGFPKLECVYLKERPTFKDMFEFIKELNRPNDIFIISNADIFFSNILLEQLEKIDFVDKCGKKLFIALSRWNAVGYDFEQGVFDTQFFDRPDSQDVWIFKGDCYLDAPYTLGFAGCDNKIAYEASQAAYNVINPSKTLKTYHLHQSNVRNYQDVTGQAVFRYPPPYLIIQPTTLEEVTNV